MELEGWLLRPPPVPVVSQSNPVYAPASLALKIHFNIILPSTPRLSKCSAPIRNEKKYFVDMTSNFYVITLK
jgi:hypothetical protein